MKSRDPWYFFMAFCIAPKLYHNPLIASNTPFYGILCGMQRIGIFGGSFNPVHSGHLGIARRAVEELSLDRLLFVPAKVNPFKVADGAVAGGLSDARRWELVRLVADLDPRFEAWDFEIRQPSGPHTRLTRSVPPRHGSPARRSTTSSGKTTWRIFRNGRTWSCCVRNARSCRIRARASPPPRSAAACSRANPSTTSCRPAWPPPLPHLCIANDLDAGNGALLRGEGSSVFKNLKLVTSQSK